MSWRICQALDPIEARQLSPSDAVVKKAVAACALNGHAQGIPKIGGQAGTALNLIEPIGP